MRVRRRGRRERGAVALIASVAMIAIFGFTALSVDLGNAWQNRRQLVTATDAAALAAAQEFAVLGNGCGTVDDLYVSKNHGSAAVTACTPSPGASAGATSGHVLVTAESTVTYAFAPIIGVNSKTMASTTVARYGIPISAGGLRPFGLCYDAMTALPEYQAWNPALGPSQQVTIVYSKSGQPNACNGGDPVPGNWATMDFDGGGNSNADIQNWTMNGYPDLVSPGPIPGDTGAFSPSLATELQTLQDTELIFPLPLFQSASGTGSNASFDVVGFVSVQIMDFQTGGSQANRSLTLRFHAAVVEGACCDASGVDTGTRVVQICAVRAADTADCVVS